MQAIQPIQPYHEHGLVFNAIIYTCGAIYAIGQLALQGLGKCWEAFFDITYESVINAGAGIYQISEGVVFVSHNVICISQMVWGCVSPFFEEGIDYTCSFFFEIWKILRDLPEHIICLIEVPGSLIGGLVNQLLSDTWAGIKQIGVFIALVVEIVQQLRDFGTIGAIIKDCIELLKAGMYQVIKLLVSTWKQTELPREHIGYLFEEMADYIVSGFNETCKLLKSFGQGVLKATEIPIDLTLEIVWESLTYLGDGFNVLLWGLIELFEKIAEIGRIPVELSFEWLGEFFSYLYSGLGEILKLYDATKEDLGNTLHDMIIDPLTPYAEAILAKMYEFLAEIEAAIVEIQKKIFG